MIPRYAEPILAARKAGQRPAELVIVSDGVAGLHWKHPGNPVVSTDPAVKARDYDWRFLAGLDVEVVTNGDRRAKALAWEIAKVKPDYLRIRFEESGLMFRIIAWGRWNVRPENDWVCQQ